ncbi:MAG TPA: Phenylacetic acid catabolic protein [Pyrinomonadaceae bacterium]|nr:Phenylacetic acid catabolic protein [Pyrinomonadaceae bacterium]
MSSSTTSAIRVESPADLAKMPAAYQDLLRHQMLAHTEGELSGADDYLQVFLPLAPNVFEKKICCERAAEEYDHYLIGAAVLSDLGVETEYMVAQRLEDRSLYASPEIHRITSWAQRGVFSFLGEDAVLDHIKEMAQSSYVPWANSFETIIRDELIHVAHGKRIVRSFLESDEGRAEVQAAIDALWPLVLSLFGKPDSSRSKEYVHWGLRQRTNREARDKYVERIVPKLTAMGLTVPSSSEGERSNGKQ